MTTSNDDPSNSARSTSFELLAESYFLSEVLQEMWFQRRQPIDVLHSRVDAFGYDLVLTTTSVTRHVQLKTRRKDGKTRLVNLNIQLESLPSACVILMDWTPPSSSSRFEVEYRWLGGEPSERIPPLGDKTAKHTKANAAGAKLQREQIRTVSIARFDPIASVSELTTRLFGHQ